MNEKNNEAKELLYLIQGLDASTQKIVFAFVQGLETQKQLNKDSVA